MIEALDRGILGRRYPNAPLPSPSPRRADGGVLRLRSRAGPWFALSRATRASRFASAYWFRTERGSVLVDAPFLAPEAEALKAAMTGGRGSSARSRDPDRGAGLRRAGGSFPSSPPGPASGAPARPPRCSRRAFHGERERLLRAGIPLASMPRTPPRVTNTFTGSLNLGFEGYTLRLFEAGEAGAPASTVVFVPETGELFAGGLVWNRVHPVTGGSDLGAWRRALAGLKRLGPRVVYPGYGEPGTVGAHRPDVGVPPGARGGRPAPRVPVRPLRPGGRLPPAGPRPDSQGLAAPLDPRLEPRGRARPPPRPSLWRRVTPSC